MISATPESVPSSGADPIEIRAVLSQAKTLSLPWQVRPFGPSALPLPAPQRQ